MIEKMLENIIWAVLFGASLAIGCAGLSLNPPAFLLTKGCFIVCALTVLGRVGWWISVEQGFESKYSVTVFIPLTFLVVGLLLSTGLQWVSSRENMQKRLAQEARDAGKHDSSNQTTVTEVAKHPPDVSKASKKTQIKSLDQFNSNLGERLRDLHTFPPGGFELSANPNPDDAYSHLTVVTKEVFGTHYYASVRLAGLENVQTMDLIGKNICVCVDPTWRKYFIWESEQSQVAWRGINVQLHESMNTLAVYQKGRDVSVFINNEYVAHFETLKTPSAGPVGIQIKANRQKGGKLYFRDLSIWEFPD